MPERTEFSERLGHAVPWRRRYRCATVALEAAAEAHDEHPSRVSTP